MSHEMSESLRSERGWRTYVITGSLARPRRLVLDHDRFGIKRPCLLSNGALQFGIAKTLAKNMKKIDMLFFNAPRCTHTVIAQLCGLVCRIPTLEDHFERPRQINFGIRLKPHKFHQSAAE